MAKAIPAQSQEQPADESQVVELSETVITEAEPQEVIVEDKQPKERYELPSGTIQENF